MTALGVQAAHDPANMIFDRKFRKVQRFSDFFVCKATGQESNELLLPGRQAQPVTKALIRDNRTFAGGASDKLK